MKHLILIFSILLAIQSFAQNGKYTSKLRELYTIKKYDKVIKFKKKKPSLLSSKSLYYQAMAYYMTEDDKNALRYFDLALNKGPVDYDMFYYKAMTLYYSDKYEESLIPFGKAIELLPTEPEFYASKGLSYYQLEQYDSAIVYLKKATVIGDCKPKVFLNLGNVYADNEQYTKATEAYKSVLKYYDPKDKKYKNCNYNIGLTQQLSKKYDEAQSTFKNQLELFPNDYSAVCKVIQTYYALGEIDKANPYKKTLLEAYEKGELPQHINRMFCIDQFTWNNTKVLVFESYEMYDDEVISWKHRFYIQEEDNQYKVETELDSMLSKKDGTNTYRINLIKNDTSTSYSHFYYNDQYDYNKLHQAVITLLNNEVRPAFTIPEYSTWLGEKHKELIKLQNKGRDGSSFKKAIIAESVPLEYQWVRANYPGYTMMFQRLVHNEGSPYDILNIKTSQGETINIYFDISNFFGKR